MCLLAYLIELKFSDVCFKLYMIKFLIFIYEKVNELVYLGSLKNNAGSCTEEIHRLAGMAKSAITKLSKIWRNCGIHG